MDSFGHLAVVEIRLFYRQFTLVQLGTVLALGVFVEETARVTEPLERAPKTKWGIEWRDHHVGASDREA